MKSLTKRELLDKLKQTREEAFDIRVKLKNAQNELEAVRDRAKYALQVEKDQTKALIERVRRLKGALSSCKTMVDLALDEGHYA